MLGSPSARAAVGPPGGFGASEKASTRCPEIQREMWLKQPNMYIYIYYIIHIYYIIYISWLNQQKPIGSLRINHHWSLIPWCWLNSDWPSVSAVQGKIAHDNVPSSGGDWKSMVLFKRNLDGIGVFNCFHMISVPKVGVSCTVSLQPIPNGLTNHWTMGIPAGITEATQGPILNKSTAQVGMEPGTGRSDGQAGSQVNA